MRTVVLLFSLVAAMAVQAQPGESARAGHGVASCCANCSSGMCAADSTAAGHEGHGAAAGQVTCCAGMQGARAGHEGHGEDGAAGGGMSCCAGMHGAGAGHEGHGAGGGMAAMHGTIHGQTHGAAETPAHAEVRAAIVALFDAMRAGDGDALLAAFRPGATLTSVGTGDDGALRVSTEGIAGFAEAVSAPHPEPYDERIGPIEVRVDGPLATAWMTYRFHVGERFSHCGVNSFQLANVGDGWKIIAVTDTRRPECEGADAE